jgi:DNA invertase Pin-like site-specific DNA recombinase
MRAVIYARYSSDLQREASIEDQIEVCRNYAAGQGWTVVRDYSDPAASGSTRFRPGYQALLLAARQREFDIVLAEALDRLSRDQEDVAALFKALAFCRVAIVTLAEGAISELHVGLKGTMNALFLKDLAAKTHRGMRGRIKEKRAAGGLSYGYAVKREIDAKGEPVRGGRIVVSEEAAIVKRIFSEFASGISPRAIAKRLNGERIAGPGGRPWQDTTIRGHAERGTGILRNELYAGRLVWNRQRFVKDPATGKRQARRNPRTEWIAEEVPELRIVEESLWERVSSRLNAIAQSQATAAVRESRFWEKRRPRHILTGLVVCGRCGHPLAAVGQDYLRCAQADRKGLCDNRRGMRRKILEDLVLEALQKNLMHPDLVAEFIRAYQEEANAERASEERERATAVRRLEQVRRQLDGLITAICEGLRGSGLQDRLSALEAEQARLEDTLRRPAPSPVRLHPHLAEAYRHRVADLARHLYSEDGRTEALEIVRSLIERVAVKPAEGGAIEIEIVGELARMVEIALAPVGGGPNAKTTLRDPERRSVKVVAGARNHREMSELDLRLSLPAARSR